VIVGSGPNWDEFDGARMKEVQTLFAVPMGMDPVMWFSQAMPVLAEAANIPMELVRKVQKAMQPPQPPAGPPIGGGNPPAPMMGANGGPTGMPQLPPAIAARMGTGPRPVA